MVTNDLFGKPFQLKFVRPAQMVLFANAVCDPPLGQATVIPFGQKVCISCRNIFTAKHLLNPLGQIHCATRVQ